jgi:hypothetical protein
MVTGWRAEGNESLAVPAREGRFSVADTQEIHLSHLGPGDLAGGGILHALLGGRGAHRSEPRGQVLGADAQVLTEAGLGDITLRGSSASTSGKMS